MTAQIDDSSSCGRYVTTFHDKLSISTRPFAICRPVDHAEFNAIVGGASEPLSHAVLVKFPVCVGVSQAWEYWTIVSFRHGVLINHCTCHFENLSKIARYTFCKFNVAIVPQKSRTFCNFSSKYWLSNVQRWHVYQLIYQSCQQQREKGQIHTDWI